MTKDMWLFVIESNLVACITLLVLFIMPYAYTFNWSDWFLIVFAFIEGVVIYISLRILVLMIQNLLNKKVKLESIIMWLSLIVALYVVLGLPAMIIYLNEYSADTGTDFWLLFQINYFSFVILPATILFTVFKLTRKV